MTVKTTDAVQRAFDALLEERSDVIAHIGQLGIREAQLAAAIDAMRPLIVGSTSEPPVLFEPPPPSTALPEAQVEPKRRAHRSALVAKITSDVIAAFEETRRPMTVRELSERLNLGEDARKLSDLLHRKHLAGELFRRVSDGLYELRDREAAALTIDDLL